MEKHPQVAEYDNSNLRMFCFTDIIFTELEFYSYCLLHFELMHWHC